MSLVKSKAIQLGFDATPTNNFLIYQPLTPDGTFRIANGNQGATTDIMTVTSGGSVTFAGTTNFSSLNFAAGSESAPSLFPTGDSNTGIWFPAADTFAVSTGGGERLRITSSGALSLKDSNSNGVINATTAAGGRLYLNAYTSHILQIQGSDKVTVDSNGYVGIGNQSPVYSLDIATPNSGNIAWQRTGVSAKKWGISSDNYGTYFGNVTDATWNILTLLNGGNVGIGVGSPSYTLDVQSTAPGIRIKATANASVGLLFNANASGSDRPGEIRYLNNNSMIFCTNGQSGTNERVRIDTNGQVGIGVTSTDGYQLKIATPLDTAVTNKLFSMSPSQLEPTTYDLTWQSTFTGAGAGAGFRYDLVQRDFYAGTNTYLSLKAGKVGIGTNSPSYALDVTGTFRTGTLVSQGQASTSNLATNAHTLLGGNGGNYLAIGQCDATYTQAQWIQSAYQNPSTAVYNIALQPLGGRVGIGTYAPTELLTIFSNGYDINKKFGVYCAGDENNWSQTRNEAIRIGRSDITGSYYHSIWSASGSGSTQSQHWLRFYINNGTSAGAGQTLACTMYGDGSVAVAGALSKGSGSFRINHPLPELAETHDLVHSFIEGPQADLIYRGKVQLINGKASVNIDSSSGMTEGTFVLLCRDVQCFTSNESDWDAVRGKVSGNILTIECQNKESSATISWMVIGERKDKHMYDTTWTDEEGRVIVEPLKIKASEEVIPLPEQDLTLNEVR